MGKSTFLGIGKWDGGVFQKEVQRKKESVAPPHGWASISI